MLESIMYICTITFLSCNKNATIHYTISCVHGYVPLVVNTSRSFPHSWLITGFVTRLTRRVSLVEQELPSLQEHLSSPPVVSGVEVAGSLVVFVCFVDRCLSFCPFSFGQTLLMLCIITTHNQKCIWNIFLIL